MKKKIYLLTFLITSLSFNVCKAQVNSIKSALKGIYMFVSPLLGLDQPTVTQITSALETTVQIDANTNAELINGITIYVYWDVLRSSSSITSYKRIDTVMELIRNYNATHTNKKFLNIGVTTGGIHIPEWIVEYMNSHFFSSMNWASSTGSINQEVVPWDNNWMNNAMVDLANTLKNYVNAANNKPNIGYVVVSGIGPENIATLGHYFEKNGISQNLTTFESLPTPQGITDPYDAYVNAWKNLATLFRQKIPSKPLVIAAAYMGERDPAIGASQDGSYVPIKLMDAIHFDSDLKNVILFQTQHFKKGTLALPLGPGANPLIDEKMRDISSAQNDNKPFSLQGGCIIVNGAAGADCSNCDVNYANEGYASSEDCKKGFLKSEVCEAKSFSTGPFWIELFQKDIIQAYMQENVAKANYDLTYGTNFLGCSQSVVSSPKKSTF